MAPRSPLDTVRRSLTCDGTPRWLLVAAVALLTVTASAAPAYVLFADDERSGAQEGPTSYRSAEAPEPPDARLPDSAILRQLGLPATGEPLGTPRLTEALAGVETTPNEVGTDPGAALELAAEDAGWADHPTPEVADSASLTEAMNRLAHTTGEDPLSSDERASIDALPDTLTEPLTRLVDAMTVATQLQRQATEDVSSEERAFLLDHAPELAAGTADEATVQRAREISSRVDMAKSVAAARVLVSTVQDIRPQLEAAADELTEQQIERLNKAHTAPQHELPPDDAIPKDPAREKVLPDTAELVRSRTHLTQPPASSPGVPLERALTGLGTAFGASIPPETLQAASNLPPGLSEAVGRVVQAYTETLATADGRTPTAAEGAADVLEAVEASRPALERWSWILHQAPPITRPLTQARATDNALGLATDSLDLGTSPTPASHALQAAIGASGHATETPDWLPDAGPPRASVTMDAWYDAFHPDVSEATRERAVADLEAQPDDVREATLTLLWAQVQADQRARQALAAAEQLDGLDGLDAAIVGTVMGAELDADAAETLREHVDLANEVTRGLEHAPAMILADAADRAQAILEDRRTDNEAPSGPGVTSPASHEPLPAPHPPDDTDTGDAAQDVEDETGEELPDADPDDTPYQDDVEDAAPNSDQDPADDDTTPSPNPPPGATDSGRDIWFEDPTGSVIVTGFQTTTVSADRHASAHIDLGGDDTWHHNAGGAQAAQAQRYAVMLDLGGDDTYDTAAPFAQAGVRGKTLPTRDGLLGTAPVGILVDARGDDDYTGGAFSQGAALGGGTGLIADLDGEDTYQVEGEWTPPELGSDIAGGQGYAVSRVDDPATAYMSATGLLAEAGGADTYQTPRGLGAGLSLFTENAQTATRQANGMLLERSGADDYDCRSQLLCIGQGRWGNKEDGARASDSSQQLLGDVGTDNSNQCKGDQGVHNDIVQGFWVFACTSTTDQPNTRQDPNDVTAGVKIGLGTAVDTGGDDRYPARLEDLSDEGVILDGTRGNGYVEPFGRVTLRQWVSGTEAEADLTARASVFVDANLASDRDGDRYPDTVENPTGYDTGDEDDNPHRNLLEGLDVQGLVFADDQDEDCWNDALEQRTGTDTHDNRSRLADHPRSGCDSPRNGYLLDLRLETTLGTGPTRTDEPHEDTRIGGNVLQVFGINSGGTVGNDGRTVPILALGDTTETTYAEPHRVALDLGGQDVYETEIGAAAKPWGGNASEGARDAEERGYAANLTLPGLAVDIDGRDTYEAPDEDVAFGAGLPGAYGVLVEMAGSDRYEAHHGLGAAFGTDTVGVLADLDGSDRRTASTPAALGFSWPACADGLEHADETIPCTGDGASIGVLVDARGRDETVGPRQAILAAGDRGNDVDAYRIETMTVGQGVGAQESVRLPDTAHRAQSLAGYVDLQGADRYVIDDPGVLDALRKAQGYAVPQSGSEQRDDGQDGVCWTGCSGDSSTEGRLRGGALFLDADRRDLYQVRARNLSLVDVSAQKNDLLLTRSVNGMEGGGESPSVFWDARGTTDLSRNPSAFGQENLDTVSGANGPDRDEDTLGRPTGTSPDGPLIQIPRLGVYVGGVGRDTYDAISRLALDLGGDDAYTAPVGAGLGHASISTEPNNLGAEGDRERSAFDVGLGLDLGGDDDYRTHVSAPRGEGTGPSGETTGADPANPDRGQFLADTQGAGVLGTGVLLDLGGTNAFEATVDTGTLQDNQAGTVLGVAQGAGVFGVGLLYTDLAENRFTSRIDTSLAASNPNIPGALGLTQGAGFSGVGLLVSQAAEAEDRYDATVVNATGSNAGRIAISQGATPSPSGTPSGTLGCGLCPEVVGSDFAVLLDRGGDDRYQVAPITSSQGANQGLVVDLGGRNTFNGDRGSADPQPAGLRGCTTAAEGDKRFVCPAQDNADRLVTIALDPSSVNLTRLSSEAGAPDAVSDALELPDGPVRLAANVSETEEDGSCPDPGTNRTALVRTDVCFHADIEGQGADQFEDSFEVKDYAFWIEQPDRPPVLADRVVPDAGQTAVERFWNVTQPGDPTGAELVDGEGQLRVVARVVPDGSDGTPGEDSSTFALRQNLHVTVDTPPRVSVGVDPTWVNATADDVTVDVTVQGEDSGDTVDYEVALVPAGSNPNGCTPLQLSSQDAEAQLVDRPGTIELRLDGTLPNVTLQRHTDDGWTTVGPQTTLCPAAYDLTVNVTENHASNSPLSELTGTGVTTFGYDDTAPDQGGTVTLVGQGDQPLDGMMQNISTAGGGSFVVGWKTTDAISGVGPDGVTLLQGDCQASDRDVVTVEEDDQPPVGTTTYGPANHEDRFTFCLDVQDRAGNQAPLIGDASTDVDLSRPTLSSPDVSSQFVQATNATQGQVTFSVNATHDGSLGRTDIVIDADSYDMRHNGSDPAAGDRTRRQLVFDDWPTVVETLSEKYETDPENLTRPEGYAYRFVVEDPAGNRVQTNEKTLIVDEVDPLLVDTSVEYTGGTAAGPGDLVRVHASVADNFGLDHVTVNATGVSSAGQVRLVSTPGTGNYSAAFVLDGEVTPPAETVTLAGIDQAGNTVERELQIDVVTDAVEIEETNVTDVTARNATVTWTTSQPSGGSVQLVNEATSETTSKDVDGTALEHSVRFDGLAPSTAYTATIVPANEAGDTAGSRTLNFTTGSLIDATITQPSEGALVSGATQTAWNATTPRSGALTYTVSFVSEHGRVPVGSTTAKPGQATGLTVATDDLLDGVYDVRLEAAQGFDSTTVNVTDVRVDNTPPQARMTSPMPGGAAPVGEVQLSAFVLDEGSGVDPDSVRFLVDEVPVEPDAIDNGTVTANLTFEKSGVHHVAIGAADEAGNAFTDGGPVAVDDSVPGIVEATLGGRGPADENGTAGATIAFAPGDAVPLRARVSEPGLAARLDASSIGHEDPVPLERSHDRVWGTLPIPAGTPDGDYTLALEVVDDAGNVRSLALPLVVDGTAPQLGDIDATPTGPGTATVTANASEPVIATAHLVPVDANRTRPVEAERTVAANQVDMTVTGLAPDTEYRLRLEVADAAGNTATATTSLATLEDRTPPDAVTGLTARVTHDGHVVLEWQAAHDDVGLAGYDVYRVDADGQTTHLARVQGTSYVDEEAANGARVSYQVLAVDRGGNEALDAAEVDAQPVAAPRLSDGQVTPEEGPPGTPFTYTVTYRGPVEPVPTVEVVINGVPHAMQAPEDLASCRDGCTFTHEEEMPVIKRDTGVHTYGFRVVVGGFADQLPHDGGTETGPYVVHGADETGGRSTSSTAIAVGGVVATFVGGLAVAIRRWA